MLETTVNLSEAMGRLKQAQQYLADHIAAGVNYSIDCRLEQKHGGKLELAFTVKLWLELSGVWKDHAARLVEVNAVTNPLAGAKKAISRWERGENDVKG
jgi:hypothetical protein